MVPLQAVAENQSVLLSNIKSMLLTELLLNDLEDLLLVEFLWQALDCRQSLTTIALW
jgi:hypothetical protein